MADGRGVAIEWWIRDLGRVLAGVLDLDVSQEYIIRLSWLAFFMILSRSCTRILSSKDSASIVSIAVATV